MWDLLAEQCITAGLRVAPGDLDLSVRARCLRARRSRARAPRPRWRRRLERCFPVRSEARLHEASTSLHRVLSRCTPAHRERVRIALLDDTIRAVREHLGLASVTGLVPTADAGTSVRAP